MKNPKLPFIALMTALAAASCQKSDVVTSPSLTQDNSSKQLTVAADNLGWQTAGQWTTATQKDYSVYYSTIADSKITSDVASSGLVLVYKKNGTSISSLPVEEKSGTSSLYWYHQVTEGKLLVLADAYGSATPGQANSFKYFVLTSNQLKTLAGKGYSVANLMNLSYAQMSQLMATINQ